MRGRAKKGKAFKKTLLQSSNLDEKHYKLHLHLKIVVSQVDYYYVAVTPKEIGRWRWWNNVNDFDNLLMMGFCFCRND